MINLDLLPKVSEKRMAVHVKPAAERALRSGHPWIFDEAIRSQSHEGQSGDLAVIFDHERRFLAIGLYDPDSPIRIKVLQHRQPATINRNWFAERLSAAAAIRKPLLTQQTDGYRLIHGENDGLPGLVIDRYADTLVLKLYTAAWLPHLTDILDGLQVVQPCEHLVLRLSRNLDVARYGLHDGQFLVGDALTEPVRFQENGLHFAADVVHGHKTGFFFDQRENRAAVRDRAFNKQALDVFAYTGGFSVYAAAGGATSVTSLDVSAPALAAAEANFALNKDNANVAHAHHKTLVADAFDGLQQLHSVGQRFDLVIVDPPSFAKSAVEVCGALAAYARLTQLALNLLSAGGVLVMASCSSRVTAEDFFKTVVTTARDSGRSLTDISYTRHALDHPIRFPEGAYLKCLFATVEN